MKFLKMIVVVAVLVTALGLGACAQRHIRPPRQPRQSGRVAASLCPDLGGHVPADVDRARKREGDVTPVAKIVSKGIGPGKSSLWS